MQVAFFDIVLIVWLQESLFLIQMMSLSAQIFHVQACVWCYIQTVVAAPLKMCVTLGIDQLFTPVPSPARLLQPRFA